MANVGGGGGAVGGAIRAGRAYVEMSLNDSSLKSGLGRLKNRFSRLASSLAGSGAIFATAGATLGGALATAFSSVVDRGVEFDRLGAKLGVPTDQLSAFAYAAETTGQDLEKLKGHLENWAERVHQGALGTGEAIQSFQKLGINAAQLKLQNPIEQLITLSEAMGKVTNETERLGMLSSFGGDQFQYLNELLKKGPEGIRGLMAEAGKVGAVVDPAEAKAASEAWQSLNRTWAAAKGSLASVGAAFLPHADAIREATDSVVDLAAQARVWLAENREIVVAVAGGAAALTGLGAGLVGLGVAIPALAAGLGAIGTILSPIAAGFGLVATAVGLVFTPVGILTAGIAALGLGLVAFTSQGRATFDAVSGWTSGMAGIVQQWATGVAETAKSAWAGIGDAIKAGDLQLAAKIAFAGLNVEFTRAIAVLTDAWVGFKETFVEIWKDGVASVKVATSEMLFSITKKLAMSEFGRGFLARFSSGASRVSGWVGDEGAKNAWKGAFDEIQKLNNSGATPEQIGAAFDKLAKADADGLMADRNRQRDDDAAFRRQQIAGAVDEWRRAQGQLQALNDEAKKKRAEKDFDFEVGTSPNGKIDVSPLLEAAKAFGQFGADNARGVFGGGTGIPQKQLDIQKKQLEEQKLERRELERLNKLFENKGYFFRVK